MRALVWFRSDLRLADHTALYRACAESDTGVVGLFVISPAEWSAHDVSPNRVDFIRRSLRELSTRLRSINIALRIAHAPTAADVPRVVARVMTDSGCDALYFNREYEVDESRRDANAARAVEGRHVHACDDQTVLPPGSVRTGGGGFFSVFTPYRRAWLKRLAEGGPPPVHPRPRPRDRMVGSPDPIPDSVAGFLPTAPPWPAGEAAAARALRAFARNRISDYKRARDLPADPGTSLLSPHLASGTISPRQCLAAAREANAGKLEPGRAGPSTWITELIWREFYVHVLVGYPRVCMGRPFRTATDRVPWREDEPGFRAWSEGRTGFPIVDAGMRQLASTGWMHNRLRMVTAMFLAKDLLIDWRRGERHFMRHLVDGFFASNNGGWQWAASTGTDAVPYFRVFNPVTQSRRFDPDGDFIRRFVPELAGLDARSIHDPPKEVRARLGYPAPLVEHAAARLRAIAAFKAIQR